MRNTKQSEQKKSQRSPEFKYIPCDAISLGISDNGVKLILGVEEMDDTTLELVGVHLTHKTAMILKTAISQGLDHYQKTTGTKIQEPDISSHQTADK